MLYALRARDHNTMGGSRESELKLLAVTPIFFMPSGSTVVMIVTPVTKVPSARRNGVAPVFTEAAEPWLPAARQA